MPFSFIHPQVLILLLALPYLVYVWRAEGGRRGRAIASLVLRGFIVVLLVLALAGTQLVRAVDEMAVVFLVDVSDSIGSSNEKRALSFVRQALEGMRPGDKAGLILFGQDALVERSVTASRELDEVTTVPRTTYTDVGTALRLGLALFPAQAQKRIVLLSDGNNNLGDAEAAAQLARASGVQVSVVPLLSVLGQEVILEELTAPSTLHQDETFDLAIKIQSTANLTSSLRVFADGRMVHQAEIELRKGLNTFALPMTAGEQGFHTFRAQLDPSEDTFWQNNELSAFALVRGAPRVLLVAQEEAEGQNLVEALTATGLNVEAAAPSALPSDLASLSDYAGLVLVNVPATTLSIRQMELLQTYVRDLGHGLVVVGGPESYGVGGYFRTSLEETLPVEMVITDKERMPLLALVMVIDKSGSMASGTGPDRVGLARKVDLAKEAIYRSVELMSPQDLVGVVAFDNSARWVVEIGPLEDPGEVQQAVSTIRADGGTSIYAGLRTAVEAILDAEASLKHIVLLTDGGASQESIPDLVEKMQAGEVTLSVVAVGEDYAPWLEGLAAEGGGRFHFTGDASSIPQIFAQETVLASRAYIVEGDFFPRQVGPSSILAGIEEVPPLAGYVATSPKIAAQLVLVSAQEDPILAQWQYGLGRAVAWTSDATGRWAKAWVKWEGFPRFWSQAVRWTIIEREAGEIETRVSVEGEKALITVDTLDEAGNYLNALNSRANIITPGLQKIELELRQTAPGRYQGEFVPSEEGAYLVHISQSDEEKDEGKIVAAQTTGFVMAYSPEYRTPGPDEELLTRLAELGGGMVVESPEQVFRHDLAAVSSFSDIWPWLLVLAVCLLPLDVGLRRLTIAVADLRRAWAFLWGKVPLARQYRAWRREKAAPAAPRGSSAPGLARLFRAKERTAVGDREAEDKTPAFFEGAEVEPKEPIATPPEVEEAIEIDIDKEDLTTRLLRAKRRAGKRED